MVRAEAVPLPRRRCHDLRIVRRLAVKPDGLGNIPVVFENPCDIYEVFVCAGMRYLGAGVWVSMIAPADQVASLLFHVPTFT